MTISSMVPVEDNDRMDPSHPRADGPQRRTFSAADKLAHLTAYEQACQSNGGGAYLRREGLYSSLISEWRKQRDAGVLDGTKPGKKIGKLTAGQDDRPRAMIRTCGSREGAPSRKMIDEVTGF
jgi:transposase